MTIPQEPAALKKCFVLSPIGAEKSNERSTADKVLKHLIRKSLGEAYDVQRADDDKNPGAITSSMIASILNADLIVADLSGLNPNVFYELAIAHGYKKATVHIQISSDRIPFDVKDMRVVRYDITDPDSLEAAQKLLREYATFAENNPGQVETPLSAGAEFENVRSSRDPVAESNVLILEQLDELRSDVRRLFTRNTRVERRSPGTSTVPASSIKMDRRKLRDIVDRIVSAGRARSTDFEAVITPTTTSVFDSWAKEHYSALTGETDDIAIEQAMFDHAEFEEAELEVSDEDLVE